MFSEDIALRMTSIFAPAHNRGRVSKCHISEKMPEDDDLKKNGIFRSALGNTTPKQ